jgi:tRNA pseudouridine55 synthase
MRGRPARPRIAWRPLHGVLLLDKPLHLTSHTALQAAKRLLRADKGGHTGTLDPLATGLLPLCFGAATKWAHAALDADKRYRATLHLGQTTPSGDRETPVDRTRPVTADRAAIDAACRTFTGTQRQRPPMHSAIKVDGRPLYEHARAGVEVERDDRVVTIHAIDVLSLDGDMLTLDVTCSKGTYIRSLAMDLGEALGCGAHLAALRRLGSGTLDVSQAITLDALEALPDDGRAARLMPPDVLLQDRPALTLDTEDAARFLCGLRRRVTLPDTPALRVYGPEPGAFLGTGHVAGGDLVADRLMSPAEVQALLSPATPTPFTPNDSDASRAS